MIKPLHSMKCCKCRETVDTIYMIVRAGHCIDCMPETTHSITIIINHKEVIEMNGAFVYDYEAHTWTEVYGCIVILEE